MENQFSCRSVSAASHSSVLRDAISSVDPAAFRVAGDDFSRSGPLTPELLLSLLLFLAADAGRHGYRDLIAAFWDDARQRGVALPAPVSAPAFCQARRKLASSAIRSVLRAVCRSFSRVHGRRFLWKGRRLLAADGTSLTLERTADIDSRFGRHPGAHRPSAHVTTIYDVLAGLPLDAAIGPATETDRPALWELLPCTRRGDVLLLDRGLPSYDLFAWLLSEGVDFVVRVSAEGTRAVEEFFRSGARDREVTLRPNAFSALHDGPPLPLRAVRADAPDGEPVVLITSLGTDVADSAEIGELYRRRWGVEEHYKLVKSDHFGQRFFHARTADGVVQEIYAQLLLVAVTRHLAASASRAAGSVYAEISTKGALLAVASRLTALALGHVRRGDFVRLLERIAASRVPKRPGRSFPRRSLTPQRRWGPNGKRRRPRHDDFA